MCLDLDFSLVFSLIKQVFDKSVAMAEVGFGVRQPPRRLIMHQTEPICVSSLVQLFSSYSLLNPKNGFVLLEEGSKQDGAVETLRAIPHV